jgi:predicted RNA methylase
MNWTMTMEREPSIDQVTGGQVTGGAEGAARPPTALELAHEIRSGGLPDDELFDRFLPFRLRMVSRGFWTPLAVAVRTAAWFAELGVGSVVDIGSGVGKFCVAAALGGTCRFIGLEQRPRLVAAANHLARVFRVEDRVTFVAGALGCCSVPAADAYYLYNPFGENRFGPEAHLDEDVELGEDRYQRDIATVEELLHRACPGTYVVTYNGFGGQVPDGYAQIRVDRTLPNMLRMWQKAT